MVDTVGPRRPPLEGHRGLRTTSEMKAIKKLLTVKCTDQVQKPELHAHHESYYQEEMQHTWDEITGAELNHGEVVKARMQNNAFVHQKNIWKKDPKS